MAHEMKAEEILIKHCPVFDPLFYDKTTWDHKGRILAAMFEFSNYITDLNAIHKATKANYFADQYTGYLPRDSEEHKQAVKIFNEAIKF